MLDAKRANEPDLQPYIHIILEFPDQRNLLIDQIKEKLAKDVEITSEEVEMLRRQYLRTTSLVEDYLSPSNIPAITTASSTTSLRSCFGCSRTKCLQAVGY